MEKFSQVERWWNREELTSNINLGIQAVNASSRAAFRDARDSASSYHPPRETTREPVDRERSPESLGTSIAIPGRVTIRY